MSLTARNNLFKQGFVSIAPYNGPSPNWTFTDNLFDSEIIYQDTTQPLDYDYNAYWPPPYWPPGFSAQLSSTTTGDGFTDGAHDIVLTSAPPYLSGLFGPYYMDPNSSLFGAGSRSPADAGLFHYTTSLDQTKEGSEPSGHKVNIGLHYVAAADWATPVPADTDGDGIPDYVENWHGDGLYANHTDTETEWQNQYTTAGIFDPTNSIYDTVDLSGNGLSGKIKEALGVGPFDTTNPLTLSGVPNQSTVSGYVMTSLGIPSAIDQFETFDPFVNGCSMQAARAFKDQTNNWQFRWDTSTLANGPYLLQMAYSLENSSTATNAVGSKGFGTVSLLNVSNILTFDPRYDVFTTQLHIAGTFNIDVASYQIDIYDTNRNLLKSIPGVPSSGQLNETWDLTDGSGNVLVSGPVVAAINVTPQGASQPIDLPPHGFTLILLNLPKTQFAAVWGWQTAVTDELTDQLNLDFGIGVVDVLNTLNNPDTDYQLAPSGDGANDPYSDQSFEWTDSASSYSAFTNALIDSQTGLFFFYGHGNWGWIGNGLARTNHPYSVLYAAQVAEWLGNGTGDWSLGEDSRAQGVAPLTALNHPYKLVILYACDAYTSHWANAFGIHYYDANGTQDTVDSLDARGLPAQSFVSWPTEFDAWTAPASRGINSEIAIDDETGGIQTMLEDWQDGFTLEECLADLAYEDTAFTDQRRRYWNIQAYKISGAKDLTRDD